MSTWDAATGKIVTWPARAVDGRDEWLEVDCGCCNGIEWGGDTPKECATCGGSGGLFVHLKSKCLALYPGGPFSGIADERELAVWRKEAAITKESE